MKHISFLLLIMIFFACEKEKTNEQPLPKPKVFPEYNESIILKKDKAKYVPQERVNFTTNKIISGAVVRYKYLGKLLEEHDMSAQSWSWTPPSTDFRGYMVEIVEKTNAGEEVLATVAVDVSSDWTKFPRYGFLSKFGNLSETEVEAVIGNLKDHHINGLQFYDWHKKHHWPLPMEDNQPATAWKDIFWRDIYLSTIQNYIAEAKSNNMASMLYNLLFGAWNDFEQDGVSPQWMVYNDKLHRHPNMHELNGQQSDILIADPSNEHWQNYIFQKTASVYEHLDFDGWHLDQLGNRGTVYDYNGYSLSLKSGYHDFLNKLSLRFPEKKMVQNAVDQYGQEEILSTPVHFAYTETWSASQYKDLASILETNATFSGGKLNTVLAAYMNYDLQSGNFNTSAVLLTDAIIFAFGGSHLELGEHMLSSEYFPNSKLTMDNELKTKLRKYYDFMTAYQNLLRDGGTFAYPTVRSSSSAVSINSWPPTVAKIAVVEKQQEDRNILHLLNFDGVTSMNWRDNTGAQQAPKPKVDFELEIPVAQTITKVWFATPDVNGGASEELSFTQSGTKVTLRVPYMQYWGMLVFEHN